MKVAILAGGRGLRLSEETQTKPKPMVNIGQMPILWHILMYYSSFGFKDFVVALGYKGHVIKKFFADFCRLNSNLKFSMKTGDISLNRKNKPDLTIDLIDTGNLTMTGGRIKRLAPFLGDRTFMLTWADGLSDINLNDLLEFHRSHGKLATLSAVRPPAKYGYMEFSGNRIRKFMEKPQQNRGWINGAFFVLEPEIFEYIEDDNTQWEKEPLEQLAEDGQLMGYKHDSFWQCMDTLHERNTLEELWLKGQAPWKIW